MEIAIHTIAAATWTKYEKWRVELELVNQPKRVCWLSDAQYGYLTSAFSHTKNGYSDSRATVIGIFDDEKGHYIKCKAVKGKHKISGNHTPLIDQNEQVIDALRD